MAQGNAFLNKMGGGSLSGGANFVFGNMTSGAGASLGQGTTSASATSSERWLMIATGTFGSSFASSVKFYKNGTEIPATIETISNYKGCVYSVVDVDANDSTYVTTGTLAASENVSYVVFAI